MERSTAVLCSLCDSIPWDRLEHEERLQFWYDDEHVLGNLQTSFCRVCRLISSAVLTKVVQHAHPQSCVRMIWERSSRTGGDVLGFVMLKTESTFVGKLILTTKECAREDMKTLSGVAPRRVDFAKISSWLENCKASHKLCTPGPSPMLLNLRVIDCIKKAVVMAPIESPFLALSYVWGGLPADTYMLGLSIEFPPTIDDAIRSTQELGYRYLWVDRYCINQEDPYDKEEQINQMGQIYASAQLTIVAAAGADPFYGLVGISRDREILPAQEPVGRSRLLSLYPPEAQAYIANSPWFSRAWTLQEGFLSKRILCFTEREAFYSCKSCSWSAECTLDRHDDSPTSDSARLHYGNDRDAVIAALKTNEGGLLGAGRILKIYSERILGYDSDTLDAIVGILDVLRRSNPPIYNIWGVPFIITRGSNATHKRKSIVSICLDWYHYRGSRRRPEFPSWSTLGWAGKASAAWGQELLSNEKYNSHKRRGRKLMSYFMIKYWSGETYRELDDAACSMDYTYRQDVTHQSQYLEITANVVQLSLEIRCVSGKDQCLLKPAFVRQKQGQDQDSNGLDEQVEGPFFELMLDDHTRLNLTLPVLCATMTPFDITLDSWSSFSAKGPLMFMFQEKGKSYERIGAFMPYLQTIDTNGRWIYCSQSDWEFVPPGEEGSWDQVAERRTFLLG